MTLFNFLLILFGKLFSKLSLELRLGNGSTWPGHLALKVNKKFIREVLNNSKIKIILVAGTNGKTTTASLVTHILRNAGKKVFQNTSGANLLNGIASSILLHSTTDGSLNYEYAVFEVDENALPKVLKEITPDYLLLLNLFRDQLDRYGEVNTIAQRWKDVLQTLPEKTSLLLNADDPQIAFLGSATQAPAHYFSVNPTKNQQMHEHATDSTYCPKCSCKLKYKYTTFSHLGDWHCTNCKLKRPTFSPINLKNYPLTGLYNEYNVNAAYLLSTHLDLSKENIQQAVDTFTPAFGRQEELTVDGKQIKIFLSKNPTGFNESLRTIKTLRAQHILFVLNDRIPDGRDVSWIWDTDIETILTGDETISVSGDRVYDMALRIKYAEKFEARSSKFEIFENLKEAIQKGLQTVKSNETLFIIPTYTGMLEVRKILTGKKIL